MKKAKAKGAIRVKLILDPEGRPVVAWKEVDGLADPVVTCVIQAATRDRYTPPGTTTKEGAVSVDSLELSIRFPEPVAQEYQVD